MLSHLRPWHHKDDSMACSTTDRTSLNLNSSIIVTQYHYQNLSFQNNPSCVAIHEAKLLWPNQKLCLVSLGTGRSPNKRKMDSQKLYSQKQMQSLFKDTAIQTSSWKTKFLRILDAATDTEQTHHILSKWGFVYE